MMNFYMIIIVFTCVSSTGIIASPLDKSQIFLNGTSESRDNDKIETEEYDGKMYACSIGNIFKRLATWFGYTGEQYGDVTTQVSSWPKAKIPFTIDRYFTEAARKIIMDAINEFHEKTCVRFVPRDGERAYIQFKASGNGCHSPIGNIGRYYNVYLETPGCGDNKAAVIHELMHVIGFIHEHSRNDRNDYVTIEWSNIQYGAEYNFNKYQDPNLNNYGFPYDFESIMHYEDDAFSINGGKTIVPKKHLQTTMGPREGFSRNDIAKINRMYMCNELKK